MDAPALGAKADDAGIEIHVLHRVEVCFPQTTPLVARNQEAGPQDRARRLRLQLDAGGNFGEVCVREFRLDGSGRTANPKAEGRIVVDPRTPHGFTQHHGHALQLQDGRGHGNFAFGVGSRAVRQIGQQMFSSHRARFVDRAGAKELSNTSPGSAHPAMGFGPGLIACRQERRYPGIPTGNRPLAGRRLQFSRRPLVGQRFGLAGLGRGPMTILRGTANDLPGLRVPVANPPPLGTRLAIEEGHVASMTRYDISATPPCIRLHSRVAFCTYMHTFMRAIVPGVRIPPLPPAEYQGLTHAVCCGYDTEGETRASNPGLAATP